MIAKEGFAHGPQPPRGEAAERLLSTSTRLILEGRERNAALAALDLEGEIERLEHEWFTLKGERIHYERHGADSGAPTFIVVHGLGDHARRHLGLAASLSERGFNSLVVDRHGHGISEGRRGDATLEADFEVLEAMIAIARAGSRGPVVLLGDSLGGIMTWYLLTREPDIDAAVCHCIGHPDVHHDPSFARRAPLLRAASKVAPYLRVGVEKIADYDQVALDAVTQRHFDDRVDELFNFAVTLRSVASYTRFRPSLRWEEVETPALVVIGAADGMVSPRFTRRSLEHARPARAEYLEIPEAGHQLFLDDLGISLEPILTWVGATLAGPAELRGEAATPGA